MWRGHVAMLPPRVSNSEAYGGAKLCGRMGDGCDSSHCRHTLRNDSRTPPPQWPMAAPIFGIVFLPRVGLAPPASRKHPLSVRNLRVLSCHSIYYNICLFAAIIPSNTAACAGLQSRHAWLAPLVNLCICNFPLPSPFPPVPAPIHDSQRFSGSPPR